MQRSSSLSKRRLPLPVTAGLRVAQVSARGLLFVESQFFSSGNLLALQAFQPQVLVGSTAELEMLAKRSASGAIDLTSLDRALIVITDCRDVPLRDSSRNALWKGFGVPTYELLLSGDGRPIAFECEAHEGWHIEEGYTFTTVNGELWFQPKREPAQGTGLTGDLDDSPCPCGQPGGRILHAAMDYRDAVRHHLAMTA